MSRYPLRGSLEFFNYLQFLPGETLPLVTISVYMFRLEMVKRNYMGLYFLCIYENFGLYQLHRHISWAPVYVSTEMLYLKGQ
jgi:hypothetical protein